MSEEKVEDKVEEKVEKPNWVSMKSGDAEKLIVELGKKGESPEKIGLILRDKHGIPKSKLLGLKIGHVLKKAGVQVMTDKERSRARIKNIETHIQKNKHDYTAKRSLTKKLWLVAEK